MHNYPHCWRTDKPVLYYPLDAWFIKTTALKGQADRTEQYHQLETGIHRNGTIRQMAGKPGRLEPFAFALLGHTLPVWVSEDALEHKCIGSVQELKSEIDKAVKAGFMKNNPFRNYTEGDYRQGKLFEHLTFTVLLWMIYILVSDTGKKMTRETDLIDVWFDSGPCLMPRCIIRLP